MKSNVRLTKQGLPDLNYYGPRRKVVAAEGAAPAIVEEAARPAAEAAPVVEAPRDAEVQPS